MLLGSAFGGARHLVKRSYAEGVADSSAVAHARLSKRDQSKGKAPAESAIAADSERSISSRATQSPIPS